MFVALPVDRRRSTAAQRIIRTPEDMNKRERADMLSARIIRALHCVAGEPTLLSPP
jgi:hypothetical protein